MAESWDLISGMLYHQPDQGRESPKKRAILERRDLVSTFERGKRRMRSGVRSR